jgi:hypothetical protein
MAHACNPSYLGATDQEDRCLKSAQANSSERPYLKKTLHRKGLGGVVQGVGPEFKPQHCQKKKKSHYGNRQDKGVFSAQVLG